MILHTARVSCRDPDALDITRGSADKALRARKAAPGEFLAPSAQLVFPTLRALREAASGGEREAIWAGYVAAYRAEMLTSWKLRRAEWEALLRRPRVVLCCFCADPQRCHRTLAAGFLGKLGADYRGESQR